MKFEDLLSAYSANVNHSQYLVNALLTALLTWILALFYRKYGTAVGNRTKFSNNFFLLALSTMLIIYIVKSSIALSLGLVGALSIVRFRAAIKEPEELTYLFLVIGIGLGMGANQAGITLIAFTLIMVLLVIKANFSKKSPSTLSGNLLLNISSKSLDEKAINSTLSDALSNIELRRMSHENGTIYLTYVVESNSFDKISELKNKLINKDPELSFGFVDNKNLVN